MAIERGERETIVTIQAEKKTHIFARGDYVTLREVEGMVEINGTAPIKVLGTTKDSITLDLPS